MSKTQQRTKSSGEGGSQLKWGLKFNGKLNAKTGDLLEGGGGGGKKRVASELSQSFAEP